MSILSLVLSLSVCRPVFVARLRARGEEGQASAEYALVLLGAAAIALLVVAWATDNDMVGKLLEGVMKHILDSIK